MKKKDQTQLEDLVRAFYYNDSQMKHFKSIAENEKVQIKELMEENEITDFIVGDLKAKYITANKESFDEEKLLSLLKMYGLNNCIRTVEVVDMDLLENAIYHKEVPDNVLKKMDGCRNTQTIVSLRVTKA